MRIKNIIYFLFTLLGSLFLTSCGDQFSVDLSETPTSDTHITRYEEALFSEKLSQLRIDELQQQFPLFLGDRPLDSVQLLQLKAYVSDSYLQQLFEQTAAVFPSLSKQENEISSAFTHVKYYYPNFEYPKVYSYISGTQDVVVFQDQIVMLSLDRYLGSGNELYQMARIPKYKQQAMQKSYITKDVLLAIAKHFITPVSADAKLLDQMIYEGKLLYFVKSMTPEIDDQILFDQSPEHIEWLGNKESDLWKYYIENQLLYKTDYLTYNKFINDAPFTAVLGDDAAPRTGIWIGYQIISSYMNNQDICLKKMIYNTDAQLILQKSSYKPRKN